jgi:O-antigen/teichoic acid export membrane protein/lysophospholipase L1-like esterase
MSDASRPLAKAVRRGARWAAGALYTGMAIRLAVSVALARLLGPADLGVMALAMAMLGLLGLVQESGLGAALVQHRGRLDVSAATALALTACGGALMTLAVVVAAPGLAALLHQPHLERVLRVLAVTCLVRGIGQAPRALLQRGLAFRALALIELGGTIVYGAVGVGLAVRGIGVWSLVAAQLASEAWVSATSYAACEPRPVPWRAERAAARELLAFGRPVMLANLLSLLHGQLPTLVVGRLLGPAPLGLYAVAQRWAALPVQGITHVAGGVAYPALARLRGEADRLAAAWLRVLQAVVALAVPTAIGLCVVANPLLRTLYDERWQPAVPILEVLAFFGLFHAAAATTGEVFKAANAPRWVSVLALLYNVVLAAALLALTRAGLTGVAIAVVLASAVVMAASLAAAARLVGTPLRTVAAVAPAPLAGSVVLAVGALGARALVRAAGGGPALALAAATAAGAVGYAAVLQRIAPDTLAELAALVGMRGVIRGGRARRLVPRKAVLAALAVVGGLLAVETGLRVTARGISRAALGPWAERRPWEAVRTLRAGAAPWPVSGGHAAWRLQPWDERIEYRLDANGFRIAATRPRGPRPACTVAVIGDSTVFGYGVAASAALPAQLERELVSLRVPARVDNAGLCASNVVHLRRWLERVLQRAPDVVTLVVTPWSLRRDVPPAPDGPSVVLTIGLRRLTRWSAVMERGGWYASHLASRCLGWPASSGVAWELAPLLESEDAFARRWHGVAAELDAIIARTRKAGARIVVAFVPLDVQVSAARNRLYREARLPYATHGFVDRSYVDDDRYRRVLQPWAESRRVPLLDATDVLRIDADAAFLTDDYHLAAAGHRRLATALASLVASACPMGGAASVVHAGAVIRPTPVAAPASRDCECSGQESGR